MSVTDKQRKQLRKLAHHRKVIIIIGQHGLSENVLMEIDNALSHHELVKVRLSAADRSARTSMTQRICTETGAELVQTIGHVGVFYRRHPDRPRLQLPE